MKGLVRSPGWYPDPEDTSRLRHWDGQRWTQQRRPRPAWASASVPSAEAPAAGKRRSGAKSPRAIAAGAGTGTGGGAGGGGAGGGGSGDSGAGTGGARRTRSRRPALIIGLVVAAAVVALGLVSTATRSSAPRTIQDAEFIRRAGAVCAERLEAIRPAGLDTRGPEEVADEVALAVTRTEELTAELRKVPVQPGDQAEVDGWLAAWDEYSGFGRQYAEALRSGEKSRWEQVDRQAREPSRRINTFARGNGITDCVFEGSPPSV